nr:hypothetical protein BaRGS_024337 [Batillaria attramentaria]
MANADPGSLKWVGCHFSGLGKSERAEFLLTGTLFDNMQAKAGGEAPPKKQKKAAAAAPVTMPDFDDMDAVNAADNKVRDPDMNCLKIDIDPENNRIKIWNNGKGIPVVEHKTEKMYVPTMIFGHLLTSSNYDDSEKKVTGGRNGYDNMTKTKEPTITESKEHDFTCVTFHPDLSKFGMTSLDADTVALFTRRAYDVAATTRVKVFLNGKKVPVKGFRDYIDLYVKDKTDEAGQPLKVVYEQVNPRWEVGVAVSDRGFQQVSFVNSIATTKGGRHVDYVADQCVSKLIEIIKKKNKDKISIKPFQVKNHLWVFVNCLIENPTFDSQTKENMTKQAKSFGSKCQLSDKFVTQVNKCGIVESVLSWMKFKAQAQLNKKCHSAKHSKLKGIPKLDDANDAGTRNSEKCTLILTEGDSAKSLAIMDNAEINNIIKIMGLHFKEKYDTAEKLKTLRYRRMMIMTDQDQDGSHIKGLLVNFVHHFWPNLLQHNFVEEFITPIVKVTKGKAEHAFYSLPEFEEWKRNTENWHTWKVKYYKGLGTSTSKEAKEYFQDMPRHRIPFKYGGPEDEAAINLAFSKKKIEERKEWLTNYMEERKRRSEMGLPERKVLFTCIKRNLTQKELKVAQLAGSVAEQSAYHHGEASLMSTIINLAQNFVGSNNLNLLQPIGQFGTRLHGGKDAAESPPLARMVINAKDDALLRHLYDDNQRIEPEWYCPIVPMVLINGADGIGTGWSTRIPNYDVREVVANLKRLLDGLDPLPMVPSFKNFRGTIEELGDNRYVVSGEVSILDDGTIEITELPVRTWTQNYKEEVLESMLQGTDKTPPLIQDYKEYHTDTTVKFVVKMSPEKLAPGGGDRTSQSVQATDHHLHCFHENKPKREIIQMLVRRGYDSDPVKAWKEAQKKDKDVEDEGEDDDAASTASDTTGGPDFNYILNLPLWSLTKERKDELLKQGESKREELIQLRKKTPNDLWMDDLEQFLQLLDEVEQQEKEEQSSEAPMKPGKLGKLGKLKPKKTMVETLPSPMGRRIQPRIDSAMKVKAEKDAARKMKAKVKKERLEFGDDGLEGMDGDVGVKEEGDGAVLASPTKGKKPGKKRNPWSDSEGSGGEISDLSDEDMDESFAAAAAAAARDRGPRRAAATKAKYTFEDELENEEQVSSASDNDMDGSYTAKPSSPVRKPSPAPVAVSDDDSPVKAVAPKRKFAGISDDDDDDDSFKADSASDDDDEVYKPKPKPKPKAAAPKPKPAAKPAPAPPKPALTMDFSDCSDSDDHDNIEWTPNQLSEDHDGGRILLFPKSAEAEKPAAKKPAAPKPAAKQHKKDAGDSKPKKTKAKRSKNSDSEGDEFAPKKKKAAAKKKTKQGSDDDCDLDTGDMDMAAVPRRGATGRAKAPVKYTFDDSEDDDFDDF